MAANWPRTAREQHRLARRGFTRAVQAVAAAGIALTTVGLAGAAAPAMAAAQSLGPPVYTHRGAGYQAHGRWFRFISTTLTVRDTRHPEKSEVTPSAAMLIRVEPRRNLLPEYCRGRFTAAVRQ